MYLLVYVYISFYFKVDGYLLKLDCESFHFFIIYFQSHID